MNEPNRSNGRRAALIVVAVAFLASLTTVGLSFYASYGAHGAAANALAKDVADLSGTLIEWQSRVADVEHAPADQVSLRLPFLQSRVNALSVWKSRTPCGEQMRDRLRAEMEKREARLLRASLGQPPGNEPIDEKAALAAALRGCPNAAALDTGT